MTSMAPMTVPCQVTPQRIGGRVTATKSGSAVTPWFLEVTLDPGQATYPADNLAGAKHQHNADHDAAA